MNHFVSKVLANAIDRQQAQNKRKSATSIDALPFERPYLVTVNFSPIRKVLKRIESLRRQRDNPLGEGDAIVPAETVDTAIKFINSIKSTLSTEMPRCGVDQDGCIGFSWGRRPPAKCLEVLLCVDDDMFGDFYLRYPGNTGAEKSAQVENIDQLADVVREYIKA